MMATLPYYRENVAPLPYEWKYIYIAGGNQVLASVYSDAAMTVEMNNPIQADSAGLYPAHFVEPGVAFDIKYFANNTVTNVPSVPRDTYLGIVAVSGSGSAETYQTKVTESATPGYLSDVMSQGDNVTLEVVGNKLRIASASDHKSVVSQSDPVPGYLEAKIALADGAPGLALAVVYSASGSKIKLRSLGMVSADGTDALGYLSEKIFAHQGVLSAVEDGQVVLYLDLDYLNNNLSIETLMGQYFGPAHLIPFFADAGSSGGTLTTVSQFRYGKPSDGGALHVPSLEVEGKTLTEALQILGLASGFLVVDASGNVSVSTAVASDHKIQISGTDTIPGYAGLKILPGANVSITKESDDTVGEALYISAHANADAVPTYISQAAYTVADDDTVIVSIYPSVSAGVTFPLGTEAKNGKRVEVWNQGSYDMEVTTSDGSTTFGTTVHPGNMVWVRCLKNVDGVWAWRFGT